MRLVEAYRDKQDWYLVYELYEGIVFDKWLKDNIHKLTLKDKAIIFKEIVYAVNHLHLNGVCHR